MLQPIFRLAQGTRLNPAMVLAPFDLAPDQPCALQDHKVLGNRIQGDREGVGNLIHGRGALR